MSMSNNRNNKNGIINFESLKLLFHRTFLDAHV